MKADQRKQSLCFPLDMLREVRSEATRQDRTMSWLIQRAWKIARKRIKEYPSDPVKGD